MLKKLKCWTKRPIKLTWGITGDRQSAALLRARRCKRRLASSASLLSFKSSGIKASSCHHDEYDLPWHLCRDRTTGHQTTGAGLQPATCLASCRPTRYHPLDRLPRSAASQKRPQTDLAVTGKPMNPTLPSPLEFSSPAPWSNSRQRRAAPAHDRRRLRRLGSPPIWPCRSRRP
jgi:hypothetical protein